MIVKNEAHIIRRCLDSVRPFIDHWLIVDTGSTDGTQALIREHLRALPGELVERPWLNFGHNRSEALALARARADYLFVIDADEVLQLPPDYRRPPLQADAYTLDVHFGGVNYGRVCLLRSALPWRYVGVLHEYPDCGQPVERPLLPGPSVQVYTDGGRSQIDTATKYARDAEVLEAALRDEPDNARYVFYLAQSYRDSNQAEKALAAYERRATMGDWIEETWYALYSAAQLAEALDRSAAEVTDRYLQAYQCRPQRAEALSALARYQRLRGQYALARLFAERAMNTPMTDDILFVDRADYGWRAADEYAVSSYWTGDYEDSRRVCERLLAGAELPASERPRVEANLRFALEALWKRPT
ncbi:glycosyltransferase [Stagnimonas aquatica]|uniref:Glycosyltransferase n=2 Tax=Stagnimonas aquatica TaxID=2689987 RepID=A0A3N0VKR5_9GAMM|nr:glycosyltransferase [Stagnimonas aquatica]